MDLFSLMMRWSFRIKGHRSGVYCVMLCNECEYLYFHGMMMQQRCDNITTPSARPRASINHSHSHFPSPHRPHRHR